MAGSLIVTNKQKLKRERKPWKQLRDSGTWSRIVSHSNRLWMSLLDLYASRVKNTISNLIENLYTNLNTSVIIADYDNPFHSRHNSVSARVLFGLSCIQYDFLCFPSVETKRRMHLVCWRKREFPEYKKVRAIC